VEPHRLVAAGRRWYLLAYDTDRDDWRIFRVDRMRDLVRTGGRVGARELPGSDPADYVASKLFDSAPTYRARVTLHAPIGQVSALLGDVPGELDEIDARSCRLHSQLDTLEWLASRLTMLGCEFEVHEPPELVEYLRALGARASRAAGAAGADGSAAPAGAFGANDG
jgi:predicted DNA-binding transcriptional regulator YafY